MPSRRPDAVLQWPQHGHRRFLEGHSLHPHSTRERMQAVEEVQHPVAAVLGCADSRVLVEPLFDTGFDDLFVVLGHEACGLRAVHHPRIGPNGGSARHSQAAECGAFR